MNNLNKEYSRWDKINALRDALKWLTPKQLEVANAVMYQTPLSEVAHRMGCSEENVTQIKQAMIGKLKQRLSYLYE